MEGFSPPNERDGNPLGIANLRPNRETARPRAAGADGPVEAGQVLWAINLDGESCAARGLLVFVSRETRPTKLLLVDFLLVGPASIQLLVVGIVCVCLGC